MACEFINEKLPAEVLSKLASFRESGTFCDVILEADSNSKAKSEATSPTSIRTHKLDIDDETLRLLADYMYTSRLNIDEKNVRALFGAAKILHLDSVRSECSSLNTEVEALLEALELDTFQKSGLKYG
ncbi:unnamed protein product [Nippostrongylus brasiliensis]|uniref:BTB domain-containing protein n=1 Tax=Nippostrongylus brasiliensis TaxID=27835 RepID=A0A158R141_NIPBR|nr:unnamed protein product [Nippostrongylus brasiliensis]